MHQAAIPSIHHQPESTLAASLFSCAAWAQTYEPSQRFFWEKTQGGAANSPSIASAVWKLMVAVLRYLGSRGWRGTRPAGAASSSSRCFQSLRRQPLDQPCFNKRKNPGITAGASHFTSEQEAAEV
jgi:hypothetical protein